jgi:hypothetical protein
MRLLAFWLRRISLVAVVAFAAKKFVPLCCRFWFGNGLRDGLENEQVIVARAKEEGSLPSPKARPRFKSR